MIKRICSLQNMINRVQAQLPRKAVLNSTWHDGRRLRGTAGDSPPKSEVGDGPCLRPINI